MAGKTNNKNAEHQLKKTTVTPPGKKQPRKTHGKTDPFKEASKTKAALSVDEAKRIVTEQDQRDVKSFVEAVELASKKFGVHFRIKLRMGPEDKIEKFLEAVKL